MDAEEFNMNESVVVTLLKSREHYSNLLSLRREFIAIIFDETYVSLGIVSLMNVNVRLTMTSMFC